MKHTFKIPHDWLINKINRAAGDTLPDQGLNLWTSENHIVITTKEGNLKATD